MIVNNGSLRCTVCNATFDTLKNMCCPKCGTNDDYIVQNEANEDEIDNEFVDDDAS